MVEDDKVKRSATKSKTKNKADKEKDSDKQDDVDIGDVAEMKGEVKRAETKAKDRSGAARSCTKKSGTKG